MSFLRKYIPQHVSNPFSMATKLLRHEKPAARTAVWYTALGLCAAPLDMVLAVRERRLYANGASPKLPILLVCGPPRSGTTLIAEYLIATLQVSFFNNLTSLFPRAPITAVKIFAKSLAEQAPDFNAYYGKTYGLGRTNDALYLWDRWLGSDRAATPKRIDDHLAADMRGFIGAWEQQSGLPLINKVNRLSTCGDLVLRELPTALIIHVRRDPVMLAQSLYIARRDITGNMQIPYGAMHRDSCPGNPVEDVCRQVEFYERERLRQLELDNDHRILTVNYEEFCDEPAALVNVLQSRIENLHDRYNRHGRVSLPARFSVSNRCRLDEAILDRFRERLAYLEPTL